MCFVFFLHFLLAYKEYLFQVIYWKSIKFFIQKKSLVHDYILAHDCQSLKFMLLQLFLNSQKDPFVCNGLEK